MSIPKSQQKERLKVCNTPCDQNVNNRCLMCGCPIEERVTFKDQYKKIGGVMYLVLPACPLKKWPEYNGE